MTKTEFIMAYNIGHRDGKAGDYCPNEYDDMQMIDAEPCEDAIRRQAVMRVLDEIGSDFDSPRNAVVSLDEIADAIQDLPSVTPKQRTGHWIETADEYYKSVNEYGGGVDENTPYFTDNIGCSVCLAMFSTIDNETERFNYCPNCGAKMESEEQA